MDRAAAPPASWKVLGSCCLSSQLAETRRVQHLKEQDTTMGLEPRLSLASLEFESLSLCPSFVLRSRPVLPLLECHPHRTGSPALVNGGARLHGMGRDAEDADAWNASVSESCWM